MKYGVRHKGKWYEMVGKLRDDFEELFRPQIGATKFITQAGLGITGIIFEAEGRALCIFDSFDHITDCSGMRDANGTLFWGKKLSKERN